MRKRFLFLFLCLLVCSVSMQAVKKFTVIGDNLIGSGMSPNGKYVVGVDPANVQYGYGAISGFKSYLWDEATGTVTWLTQVDASDYGKSGYFTDVNDNKTIVGYCKDPDYQITVVDLEGPATLPVCVASVWKDGARTCLGIGDFKLSDFNNFADGSYATSVSADGKTVAGFITCGNFAVTTPCMWKFNEGTRKWDFSRFTMPAAAKGGQVLSVSSDGKIAVGMVKIGNRTVSAYWKSVGECILIEGKGEDAKYNEDYTNCCAYKVSSNGKYIAFAFGSDMPGLFIIDENRYVKPGTFKDVKNLEISAVSDNGDVMGAYQYGNFFTGTYTRPFWYSLKAGKNMEFDYYIKLYGAGLDIPLSFTFEEKVTASIRSVSADGKIVMGNNNGKTNWILQTEAENVGVPESVIRVGGKVTQLKEVTLTWDKVVSSGFNIQSYNIYCDGSLVGNTLKDVTSFVHKSVEPGYRKYALTAVYAGEENEKTIESPKSDPIEICVASTFGLPLNDNFDSGSTDLNYWTKEDLMENPVKFFWGCPQYMGIESSHALMHTVSTDGKPYASALISRFMDATDQDHVYISYVQRFNFVNSNDWPLDGDTLSVEVSTDGNTWIPVKHHLLTNIKTGQWRFELIDISGYVAHKLFQVRLRSHGKGIAQVSWFFDLFNVGTTARQEGPEDLTGKKVQNKVSLMWKNSIGAYELNYLDNPYNNVFAKAIGDEGKPFIAVNSFDPADLAMYEGKYITSIKAFINHDTAIEDSQKTHASIVIYENNQLVREQEITSVEYNKENLVILDEPIAVDPAKELKFGLKIFDYDARQIPVTYQNTINFIAGKSDLYSQDNGKTWKKLSDFYSSIEDQELDGYCSWEITANVTDEATVSKDIEIDENLMAYNVYRNGEKLNDQFIYYLQPRFVDESPLETAYYEVVAFYFDGTVSERSARFNMDGSSIGKQTETDVTVYPNPATDIVNISGKFDKVILLSVDGQTIMETTQPLLVVAGLPSGVYLIKIQNGEKAETRKIMIRN